MLPPVPLLFASVKFKLASASLATLILGQEAPKVTGTPIPAWLDLGVTIAAIALLGYILRLVFTGALVSKPLIEQVVEKCVRDIIRELDR